MKNVFILGLTKDCLDFVFDTVKEKAKNLIMWKGFKRTRKNAKKLHKKYIKVCMGVTINISR